MLKQFTAKVISNKVLLKYPGAEYYLMDLYTDRELGEFIPGQFIMIRCSDDTLLRRPISIHSVLSNNIIQILYAVSTPASQHHQFRHDKNHGVRIISEKGKGLLSKLKRDEKIDIIGPLGNGYKIHSSSKSLLLVAGGIGIAPLRFLAEKANAMKKSITMLLGARYPAGLYPHKLLPETTNIINIVENTDGKSHYKKGLVVDLLHEYIQDYDQVFACGPVAMYRAMQTQLEACDYMKPVQVSLEVRMGCGFGVCYGCSIKTVQGMKRVCKEGPVFNIKDIIWQEVKI